MGNRYEVQVSLTAGHTYWIEPRKSREVQSGYLRYETHAMKTWEQNVVSFAAPGTWRVRQ
jgi:hypothetical protein